MILSTKKTKPAHAPLVLERRRPFRLWMSGSIAVVMAAIMPIRDAAQTDRLQSAMRWLRHTHLGVGDTVRRLEQSAQAHGLPVLALVHGQRSVLVLGSAAGGTPVVMEEGEALLSVPLSLMVREAQAGGADVLVAADRWLGLPDAVADELATLPALVERALT